MNTVSKWSRRPVKTIICTAGLMLSLVAPTMGQTGFTELVPSGPTAPPVAPGAGPWGAGVKLAAAFLGWLNDQGVKTRINAKLNELKPDIDAAMPASGGVLVVVGIQQSVQPDVNGNYVRSVLDGYVAGAGANPKATMDDFLAHPRLEQGVPSGFVRRNVYFWKAAGNGNSKKSGGK